MTILPGMKRPAKTIEEYRYYTSSVPDISFNSLNQSFKPNISMENFSYCYHYLENLVFIELLRKGHEVYFHQGKKECDFVVREGLNIRQAIQVSRTLHDEETKKRELEGLTEALDTYGLNEGIILTEDEEYEIDAKGRRIFVQPVWKWLLENGNRNQKI